MVSPLRGHWRGVLMFSLMCAWTNGWANHPNTGDMRRHGAYCDVIVMRRTLTTMLCCVCCECFGEHRPCLLRAHAVQRSSFGWRNQTMTCPLIITPNEARWRTHVSLTGSSLLQVKHYNDVIMGAIASQITSLTIVYSTVYSGADQRKHQSSASLAFVRAIHRGPVNSPWKKPVTRKMFPFDDVIMG